MEYIGKRISVIKSFDELSVVVLSAVENKKTVLLLSWLIAWTACGFVVIWEYFKATNPDIKIGLVIWLAFWFYFEYTILKAYMWRRNGKEKIKIKNEKLLIKREVNNKGTYKMYDLGQVKELRLLEEKNQLMRTLNNSYWAVAGETIAFDYYGKTVAFGLQLNEEDTKDLFRLLKHYIKQLSPVS